MTIDPFPAAGQPNRDATASPDDAGPEGFDLNALLSADLYAGAPLAGGDPVGLDTDPRVPTEIRAAVHQLLRSVTDSDFL